MEAAASTHNPNHRYPESRPKITNDQQAIQKPTEQKIHSLNQADHLQKHRKSITSMETQRSRYQGGRFM